MLMSPPATAMRSAAAAGAGGAETALFHDRVTACSERNDVSVARQMAARSAVRAGQRRAASNLFSLRRYT